MNRKSNWNYMYFLYTVYTETYTKYRKRKFLSFLGYVRFTNGIYLPSPQFLSAHMYYGWVMLPLRANSVLLLIYDSECNEKVREPTYIINVARPSAKLNWKLILLSTINRLIIFTSITELCFVYDAKRGYLTPILFAKINAHKRI